jgi:hypothetical protein
MRRFIAQSILVVALSLCALSVQAFSLAGPEAGWQTGPLGYNTGGTIHDGPQNLNEEYRWNAPVLFYAFDPSFIEYFGTNGMLAVEQAMKILNDIPPASQMTDAYLNALPLDTTGVNFTASTLGIIDLKSAILSQLVLYMGLDQPGRYTWTLRSRQTQNSGGRTITNYVTIMRNFDPITFQPTNAVNGQSFDYVIQEDALGNADAFETVPGSPLPGVLSTAVAEGAIGSGLFYFGLTRDDLGGLRYIYRTNNLNFENLPANTSLATSTPGTFTSIGTGLSPYIPVIGIITNAGGTVTTNAGITNFFFAVTNGLRPGVDKLTFRRVNFDGILGTTFQPVTNIYTDRLLTVSSNGFQRIVTQRVERRITFPDIVFSASDLGLSGNPPTPNLILETDPQGSWINNAGINSRVIRGTLNGPGNITPFSISLSSLGPYFLNVNPGFTTGPDVTVLGFAWGSYDDISIKAIYPEYLNMSIADLEALFQATQGTTP